MNALDNQRNPHARDSAHDLRQSYRAATRHACLFLQALREFDLRKSYRETLPGGKVAASTPAWLHTACGIDEDAARDELRIAYALLNLPHIEDAFERGDLSHRKVRALTTVATAANETALMDFALAATDAQVAAYCKAQTGLANGRAHRKALGGPSGGDSSTVGTR